MYNQRLHGLSVVKLKLDGKLIKKYKSLSIAGRENKLSYSKIHSWCIGVNMPIKFIYMHTVILEKLKDIDFADKTPMQIKGLISGAYRKATGNRGKHVKKSYIDSCDSLAYLKELAPDYVPKHNMN